jgi:hypothetical protein
MTWEMLAMPNGRGDWSALGDAFYVRLHGCKNPTPVVVIEDPEGDYFGWIDAEDELEGDDTPSMIQRKEIFNVQFAYGYEEEEKRGRGRSVRLRIEERS